jgi:arylsulfatase A-like enzyme
MIEEVDWSVGQVLQTVKALNLDGKTLVIFTSDNGHDAIPRPPLHGRKSQCWEGGFRVPCIARWPGRVPAGAECREMTVMFDWLPTLASLAGTEPPVKRTIDGKDIWQTLCSKAKTPHDHFVYYNIAGSASAIRCGRWKLHVLPSGGGDGEDLLARKPAEAPPWLYDLEADLGETQNVAKAHPDVVKLLREKLQHTDKVLTQEARPVWDNPKNAAPKTGVGAMAMPEAGKGWKATQDLPADTVVTDYNDYIEKLPGVERFGVADVKYYVDDTGRNAVAILVNVGDTQWTHLLVYDKQDKRTGVTKFVAGK